MKILLWSNSFHPNLGGIETVSRIHAEEFSRLGHQVTVITRTPSQEPDLFPFQVIRQPTWPQLMRHVMNCDVYLQNHISLKSAWPLLCLRRPWIVAIHAWVPRSGFAGHIKHFMTRFAKCISVSAPVAAHLSTRSVVIGGPYDNLSFRLLPSIPRNKDLIFVGRLLENKGIYLLLEVLLRLNSRGLRPTLTFVGGGPESNALANRVNQLGLSEQVTLTGPKLPSDVAKLLNQHSIMVVPSLFEEPLGVVALEGIACGCVVVGSQGGGLKDAIGSCGVTFPNKDAAALDRCLAKLLEDPPLRQTYQEDATAHLQSYTRATVASRYLEVLTPDGVLA